MCVCVVSWRVWWAQWRTSAVYCWCYLPPYPFIASRTSSTRRWWPSRCRRQCLSCSVDEPQRQQQWGQLRQLTMPRRRHSSIIEWAMDAGIVAFLTLGGHLPVFFHLGSHHPHCHVVCSHVTWWIFIWLCICMICRLSLFSLACRLQSHDMMNIHVIVNVHVLQAVIVLISISAAVTWHDEYSCDCEYACAWVFLI